MPGRAMPRCQPWPFCSMNRVGMAGEYQAYQAVRRPAPHIGFSPAIIGANYQVKF